MNLINEIMKNELKKQQTKVAYVQYDATLETLEKHLEVYKEQFQGYDAIVVPKLGSIAIC